MRVEEAEERLKDYLLNGIAKEIFLADEAYALAEEIGRHAEAIHADGFASLFGTLQVSLSDRQTLSITKMFDRPSRYPTRSILAILDMLSTNAELWGIPQRHVLHQELIGAGVERSSVERLSNVALTHAIVNHYENTLTNLYPALMELRQSRDKVIAHNEAIERSLLQSPTWGAAISVVKYAKDFVSTIGFGYLSLFLGSGSGRYCLAHDARRTTIDLRRLLEAADITRGR